MAHVNCHTFIPLRGVTPGIALATDLLKQGGGTLPAQLGVGPRFVAVDTFEPKSPDIGKRGMLFSAVLRQIDTEKASFQVFSKPEGGETRTKLVFIDLVTTPTGVKRKFDPSVIRAWVGFYTNANLVAHHSGSGRALVEFNKEGQSCLAFDFDGMVHRLVYRGGEIIVDPLTPVEVARERIRLARDQIAKIDDREEGAVKRLHGIAGGLHRLFDKVKDGAAREEFVEFFLDYAQQLPVGLRRSLYEQLEYSGHQKAATFAAGYGGGNVVSIDSARNKGPKDPEAFNKAKGKRRDRSQRDKELRLKMKGAAGGGRKG